MLGIVRFFLSCAGPWCILMEQDGKNKQVEWLGEKAQVLIAVWLK